jgi:ABC-type transport system substrate-binding protein
MGGVVLTGLPMTHADGHTTPIIGGTLIYGPSETTQNLDIHQTGPASTGRLQQDIHYSIATTDKDLNISPNLTRSFEQSEDGPTYTFTLRNDVMFQAGTKMASADMRYSFERCANLATGTTNFEMFNAAKSFKTTN